METYQKARMYYGDNLIALMPKQVLVDNLYQIMVGHFTEEANREDFRWNDGESVGEVHERLHTMLTAFSGEPSYQWREKGLTPVATEAEVVVDLDSDSHVLRGFIDLIVETPQGVIGVDHKTAGRAWGGAKAAGDPRKLIQAPLYAEGWMRQTGQEMVWFAYDVMTYAGKFQRVWVDVRPEVRKPFIERWQQTAEMVSLYEQAGLELPTNPSNNLCSEKWCSYWEICPMGAELDRTTTT
jgi:hypothetical protein